MAFHVRSVRMADPFPTFYVGIGEALGAYGRGIVQVLDPATPPLFEDPKLIN